MQHPESRRNLEGSATPLVIEANRYLPLVARVVDFGAGVSPNSIYLANEGHEVTALELDFELAKRGHNSAQDLGIHSMRAVCADIIRPPLQNTRFDAGICTSVLQELNSRAAVYGVLEQMMELTKPGGLNALVVYVANPADRAESLQVGGYLFAPGELAEFYQLKGWEVIDSAYQSDYLGYIKAMGATASEDHVIAFNNQEQRQTLKAAELAKLYPPGSELGDFYAARARLVR